MNKEFIASIFGYFVGDGDTVDGVLVGREAKPDANPTGNWPALGTIPKGGLSIAPDQKLVTVERPQAGGGWARYDTVPTQVDWNISAMLQDFDLLVLGLMFGSATAPPAASTSFAAFANKASRKGWLKLQFLDVTGAVIARLDAFGRLSLKEIKVPGDNLTTPGFEFQVLSSPLNAGLVVW
jgi:hypothetical protein